MSRAYAPPHTVGGVFGMAAGLATADRVPGGTVCHGRAGDRERPDGDILRPAASHRRAGWTRPVLMPTPLGTRAERAALVEQGADDWLVRPFTAAGLTARTRALYRPPVVPGRASPLRFGDLAQCRGDGQRRADPRTVDALIIRLRRRLGPPDLIQAVRGIGYRLSGPA